MYRRTLLAGLAGDATMWDKLLGDQEDKPAQAPSLPGQVNMAGQ
jgi:hypothetical protein